MTHLWSCRDAAIPWLTLLLWYLARQGARWYVLSAGVEMLWLPHLRPLSLSLSLAASYVFPIFFSALAEYFASSHDPIFSCTLLLAVTLRLLKGKPQRKTYPIRRSQGSHSENEYTSTARTQIIRLLSVKDLTCDYLQFSPWSLTRNRVAIIRIITDQRLHNIRVAKESLLKQQPVWLMNCKLIVLKPLCLTYRPLEQI